MESIRWKKNPELFFNKGKHNMMSSAKHNNEVNGLVGWAVKSSSDLLNFYNELEFQLHEIYKAMTVYERDVDEKYLELYYDTNMAMLNQGGLTLISMAFFEWAKALILVVRDAFTEESIDRKTRKLF